MLLRKSQIKKILLIKFRGIGDVILSTVVLKNIKSQYPDAVIDFLTERPSAQLLKEIPLINEVLIYNFSNRFEIASKILEIRRRKYDLVIDLYSNPKSAQLTFGSGAKFRAGFPYRGRKYAYNLYGPAERGKHHAGELHLLFLERIGIEVKHREQYLMVSKEAAENATKFFKLQKDDLKFCALVPGGGWESKRCDPEKFAEIGRKIYERYGLTSLILWGKGDLDEAEKIKAMMTNNAVLSPETLLWRWEQCRLGVYLLLQMTVDQCTLFLLWGFRLWRFTGPQTPRFKDHTGINMKPSGLMNLIVSAVIYSNVTVNMSVFCNFLLKELCQK